MGLGQSKNSCLIGNITRLTHTLYTACKQIHFYQIFLNIVNAIGIVNTYCSIVRVRNHLISKTQNCFSSFFCSCQKLYSAITLLYDKLVGRRSNKNTALIQSRETNNRNLHTLKSTSKCRVSTGRVLPAIHHLSS